MDKQANSRTNVIGGSEAGVAVTVEMDKEAIHQTNSLFWDTKGNEVLGATALPMYGAFVSEEKHQLFGEVSGKKILEIGCGSGQSLQYLGERKPAELWGTDISENQINKTRQLLTERGLSAELICAPMEDKCGLPEDYFDIIYSVYAIGWTTDLEGTFSRIASYLNKDGVFIFSWSHPIHKCVAAEKNTLAFKKSYFDESWYTVALGDDTLSLSDRKMSTYINALAKAGFIIEKMVEESDDDLLEAQGDSSDFAKKARMLPVTFVIKARKL
ncbi:methyltransferase type 11 [Paenibacillus sp. FSL R7-0273]|uniref:class I SAM-dependent methyltransferase n=1 Tax=Paenibacillus sp. FSL R7-0273 TaxID=1536772 RepID=UPI0004F707AB|nr:class I SAM-dependent methyltransferase [Paenibacillus sp. FSL R7-0273]AIQ47348.1 methyltransferase type 11 [Paenibacillus sp. FSL R7-0273]OMF96099.1 SAM-dependent methyltransferase [Paenibacillus sp. FSL R7-0273]